MEVGARPAEKTAASSRASKGRALAPAVGLFFVAPLIAEFLLGNLPIKMLPALVVLAPLYGGGALLIREVVRRTGRGWSSILLLGMAYAIFEEAFTTQSLFNRDYLHLHLRLLDPAWIPALGIGGWWTLWMLNVHSVWSIATPIALVEACVPDRAPAPWLGRAGLCVTAVLFVLGAGASTAITLKQDRFLASGLQFAVAALVCVGLVVLAFRLPRRVPGVRARGVPAAALVGVFSLLLGSAALLIPESWGWGALAALLGCDLVALGVVLFWSGCAGWTPRHTLALAGGAALAYGWHSFLQHPAVGQMDASVRVGNALFTAAAVGLVGWGWRRVSSASL